MPRSRLTLATPILIAGLVGAGAAAVTASAAHPHKLPEAHALVRIDALPDGLRVSHVQMSVTHGRAGALVGHFTVTVRNPRSTAAHRILMLGTCGGESCRQIRQRPTVIGGGQTRTLTFAGALPADARDIQGALRKPGVTEAYSDNATVLLTSGAWTGREAGKPFGLSLAPNAASHVRKVNWHLSTQHGPRATMRLSFNAAPDAAGATLSRCDARCAMTTLQPDPQRSTTAWDIRPIVDRQGADEVRLGIAAPGGAALLSANLPWPTT
jgi:hypothetical protein